MLIIAYPSNDFVYQSFRLPQTMYGVEILPVEPAGLVVSSSLDFSLDVLGVLISTITIFQGHTTSLAAQ
jgi:hypothetical protein